MKHKKTVRPLSTLLPLGALAAGFGLSAAALAQTAPPPQELPAVKAKAKKEAEQGKDGLQATETSIGKGRQEIRDIPQSITVVTEKLIDDRNLDTLKETLKQTAGISFLAAEGGEEDIRLRGFPLQATGDVFVDGMRDPAFYERDTFNYDRLEVLRGSASMLFGRGSTGGAVNQVNKQPRLIDQPQRRRDRGQPRPRARRGRLQRAPGPQAARCAVGTMVDRGRQQRRRQQHQQDRPGRRLAHRHWRARRVPGQPLPPRERERHELRHALHPPERQLDRGRHHPAAGRPDDLLRPGQRPQPRQRQAR